jgi:hypothetical protein
MIILFCRTPRLNAICNLNAAFAGALSFISTADKVDVNSCLKSNFASIIRALDGTEVGALEGAPDGWLEGLLEGCPVGEVGWLDG